MSDLHAGHDGSRTISLSDPPPVQLSRHFVHLVWPRGCCGVTSSSVSNLLNRQEPGARLCRWPHSPIFIIANMKPCAGILLSGQRRRMVNRVVEGCHGRNKFPPRSRSRSKRLQCPAEQITRVNLGHSDIARETAGSGLVRSPGRRHRGSSFKSCTDVSCRTPPMDDRMCVLRFYFRGGNDPRPGCRVTTEREVLRRSAPTS